jgi:hypothetical protein
MYILLSDTVLTEIGIIQRLYSSVLWKKLFKYSSGTFDGIGMCPAIWVNTIKRMVNFKVVKSFFVKTVMRFPVITDNGCSRFNIIQLMPALKVNNYDVHLKCRHYLFYYTETASLLFRLINANISVNEMSEWFHWAHRRWPSYTYLRHVHVLDHGHFTDIVSALAI